MGSDGGKQREIEQATGATLHYRGPSSGNDASTATITSAGSAGEVVLRAPTKEALSEAWTATQELFDGALHSRALDYTHFLSLPLVTPAITQKLEEFKQLVSSWGGGSK